MAVERKRTEKAMEVASENPEEDCGVSKAEKKALDLFGGEIGVLAMVTRVVRERLETRGDLDELEGYLGLDKGLLRKLVSGEMVASKQVFVDLKAPLRLSLGEILGSPDEKKCKEHAAYWEDQWKRRPMRLVALAGKPAKESLPENPIDFRTYLLLRAVGEFYRL
jgi:hypothetical protein